MDSVLARINWLQGAGGVGEIMYSRSWIAKQLKTTKFILVRATSSRQFEYLICSDEILKHLIDCMTRCNQSIKQE